MSRERHSAASLLLAGACWLAACGRGERGGGISAAPDSLPVFIGDSLPFDYPPPLYLSLIQGDVTLRLHLDEYGRPVPESTRVEEHALHPAFDSSALRGAGQLVFRPAYRGGRPIPYTILFPIKFRVPDGPPMPGDSSRGEK